MPTAVPQNLDTPAIILSHATVKKSYLNEMKNIFMRYRKLLVCGSFSVTNGNIYIFSRSKLNLTFQIDLILLLSNNHYIKFLKFDVLKRSVWLDFAVILNHGMYSCKSCAHRTHFHPDTQGRICNWEDTAVYGIFSLHIKFSLYSSMNIVLYFTQHFTHCVSPLNPAITGYFC